MWRDRCEGGNQTKRLHILQLCSREVLRPGVDPGPVCGIFALLNARIVTLVTYRIKPQVLTVYISGGEGIPEENYRLFVSAARTPEPLARALTGLCLPVECNSRSSTLPQVLHTPLIAGLTRFRFFFGSKWPNFWERRCTILATSRSFVLILLGYSHGLGCEGNE